VYCTNKRTVIFKALPIETMIVTVRHVKKRGMNLSKQKVQ